MITFHTADSLFLSFKTVRLVCV